MTAEALTSLPFSAGGAVASAAGRAVLWGLSAYMQAPLRNTAVTALVTLSAMAGSNALYRQTHHHPAPLFGAFEATTQVAKTDPTPVMPAARPQVATKTAATGAPSRLALPATTTAKPLTRDDISEAQRKLESLGLFTGKIDGFYGPKTATAIKAFEQDLGMPAKGELTPEILARLRATTPAAKPAIVTPAPPAPTPLIQAKPAPLALTEPAKATPAVEATASLASAEPEAKLPAPAPLLRAAVAPEPTTTASVDEAAVAPMAEAAPTSNVAKRTVQTIAVRAQSAAPATQAMPPELTVPADGNAATDPQIVAAVQRGLTSLGFLHGEIDGVAGEATAKAIRNFEVYFNYDVTGRITSDLVKLLVQNGGVI